MLQWGLLWIGHERSRDLEPSHNSHCIQLSTHKWPGWDCCIWRSGQLKPHTRTTKSGRLWSPNGECTRATAYVIQWWTHNVTMTTIIYPVQVPTTGILESIPEFASKKKRKLNSYPKLRDIWRFKAKSPGPSLNPGFPLQIYFSKQTFSSKLWQDQWKVWIQS